uniref:Transposase n=1 Tax=Ditylenchus dipsaci TaxID=166011 RepID=A0A915DV64_9BILA
MSLFRKLSSISMQQVVNLIEDEDESWPEEAESLSLRVKQARRCKIEFDDNLHLTSFWSSKSYGYRFDLVLRKADNKELGIVKCNLCPATSSKSGTKGLKGHVAFHSGKSVTTSEFNKSLIKFLTCSAQPFRLVDDLSFIEFLESFRLLASESFKMNVIKEAKDFLPCGYTISRRIDDACSTVQNHVSTDVSNLMLFGGGLTIDFAKNRPFREKNSLVSDLLAIVKLSRIDAYVDVLKPIAEMVIDLQAEKESTSNKILAMPLLYGYICKL